MKKFIFKNKVTKEKVVIMADNSALAKFKLQEHQGDWVSIWWNDWTCEEVSV